MLELLLVVKLLLEIPVASGRGSRLANGERRVGLGCLGGALRLSALGGVVSVATSWQLGWILRVGVLWGWVWFLIVSLLFWGVVGGTSLN